MRNIKYWAALAASLVAALGMVRPAIAQCGSSAAQSSSSSSGSAPAGSSSSSASSASTAAPQDGLAAAARKAREQKKEAPKTAKVFTNDNMPTQGTISSVGAGVANSATATSTTAASGEQGEAYWRDKFSKLQAKLSQDQSQLAVAQRELGVLSLQNYSDPNVAMQQGYSRADLDKKNAEIDQKKKDIAADQQTIEDTQSEMLKAGGQPGWAR